MGEIILREVKTKSDKRKFIYFPAEVHKNNPDWLPPIYMDEWELFDEKNNKSYKYADTVLYLAEKDNKTIGRIMGIINRRYNAIHNEEHGRFCFLECYDDQEVAHALITRIEEWARGKGMVKLVGPLAFSDKDPQGFQIEGFEYPSFIVCPTNDSYMPEIIMKEGYTKLRDLVNYLAKTPEEMPEVYVKILSRVSKNEEYKIISFKNRKEIKPYIIPVLELLNQTFMEIYGFTPLTDQEKKEFAARYMMILDPKFIKAVEAPDGLIGFAIGIPDFSDAIRKSKGRMFPFGILRILWESRRSKKLLMLLGGVRKDYRGKGIDVLMAVKMLEASIEQKMEQIDLHLVLETNTKMRAECERIGGTIIKRFRIYQKDLV
jgi:GNAT superfamily N-acetyltransferase